MQKDRVILNNAQTITTSMAEGGLKECFLFFEEHPIYHTLHCTIDIPPFASHPKFTVMRNYLIFLFHFSVFLDSSHYTRINRDFKRRPHPDILYTLFPYLFPSLNRGDIYLNWNRVKEFNRNGKGKKSIYSGWWGKRQA